MVACSNHNCQQGKHDKTRQVNEAEGQHQEFGNKTCQAWQTKRCHKSYHHNYSKHWHLLCKPAEIVNDPGASSGLNCSCGHEQDTHDKPMGKLLEHGA